MMEYKTQAGFSLVETLVAITILLVVIVGPMTIMSTASNSASFASDQVVAFFLAQEGTELAQKARDDLVIQRFAGTNPDPWADFTDDESGSPTGPYEACFGSGCSLEMSNVQDGVLSSPNICSGTSCDLYFDDTEDGVRSRYTHTATGNTPTPYSRVITFQNLTDGGVLVTSRVEWFTGNRRDAQSVEVQTVLIDVYGP